MSDGRLRFVLTVPSMVALAGPVLKHLLGVDLDAVLEPLADGPRQVRERVVAYPLAIPDGDGATIPVKGFGEVGLRNQAGFLILVIPAPLVVATQAGLATEIAANDAVGPRFRGTSGEFAVRLKAGMKKAIPLGSWGEIGVEAA